MLTGTVEADQLRLFIERIERLEEEKKGIADDVKDVYAEAKANGYDTKTMRKIVALRKMDPTARQEADALLETYRAALGMDSFNSTPLSQAAEKMHNLADEHGASIEVQTAGGETIAQFGKKAKAKTKKVRDPSDGGLVTVAANA